MSYLLNVNLMINISNLVLTAWLTLDRTFLLLTPTIL